MKPNPNQTALGARDFGPSLRGHGRRSDGHLWHRSNTQRNTRIGALNSRSRFSFMNGASQRCPYPGYSTRMEGAGSPFGSDALRGNLYVDFGTEVRNQCQCLRRPVVDVNLAGNRIVKGVSKGDELFAARHGGCFLEGKQLNQAQNNGFCACAELYPTLCWVGS